MEFETQGAWLIHHARKLEHFSNPGQYDNIFEAGKCGILLSILAESDQTSVLPMDKVTALAKASNINRAELKTYLAELEKKRLIQTSNSGVEVLGLASRMILNHTASLFKEFAPNAQELAVLELAELVSNNPVTDTHANEYLGDLFKIDSSMLTETLDQAEHYGFTDAEKLDTGNKLYFNGNLFKTDDPNKLGAVLSSLNPGEERSLKEFDAILNNQGCVSKKKACQILGDDLFSKVQSIGMFDLNEVANSTSTKYFVTKPSSFNRFGNPFEDDALDLAKALVTSLYYGMTLSSYGRGKISQLQALMRKLILGYKVGPATAIGQDYQVLEFKRVVEITKEKASWGMGFSMRLIKKDIGRIALKVLQGGNASEDVLLKGASVNRYTGPEFNREITRKKQNYQSRTDVANTLRLIRKK